MTTKVSISVSRNRDEKKAFLGVVFFFPFLALQEEAEIKENDFFSRKQCWLPRCEVLLLEVVGVRNTRKEKISSGDFGSPVISGIPKYMQSRKYIFKVEKRKRFMSVDHCFKVEQSGKLGDFSVLSCLHYLSLSSQWTR